MLEFSEIVQLAVPAEFSVTLPWDLRQKSRFLARLDGGTEAGFVLPRGTVLEEGMLLRASNQQLVRVRAAPEDLSVARAPDASTLLRAAYHLGNRHVPVELGTTRLAYQHDHVLDDMVRDLGLEVTREQLPFQPESGAYKKGTRLPHGGHRHGDEGGHGHAHGGHSHGQGGHSHGHGGHSHD